MAVSVSVTAQPAPPQAPPETQAKPRPKPAAAPARPGQLSKATLDLFKAVELNDMTAVKSNIEAGADLFAENDDGMTAADLAVDKGHFIVAHYLLSRRLLSQTPPIALVPGKTKMAAKDDKADKPKRKFASPPPKPPSPEVAPEIVEAPKPQEPMRVEVTPAPEEAIAEVQGDDKAPDMPQEVVQDITEDKPGEATEAPGDLEAIAEIPASDVSEATGTVAETLEADKPPADKPLADQGLMSFFKSLVDLITPGGEGLPKLAEKEPAPAETGLEIIEAPSLPEGTLELPSDETIVETPVQESDEIIVEVDPDAQDGPEGESIVEIAEDTPIKLVDSDLETVTAVPDEEEKPKKEEGFLDRMASLFTSDEKPAETAEAIPGETGEPAKADEVREYDLPMPPPLVQAPKKMSPRFLDRLADFLETGDEEAFQAWLPETQLLNPDARNAQLAERPPEDSTGPKPETGAAEAPAPDKAPKPPVEESPLAAPWSTADKPAAPTDKADKADMAEKTDMAAEPSPDSVAEAARKALEGTTEETAEEKPGLVKGVFNKLVDVLTPDFGSRERPERLILDPDEKLAQVETKEDGDGEEPPKYWPITEVKTAEKPPISTRRPPSTRLKTSLSGITLALGQSVSLENSYPPMDSSGTGIDPHNKCVKKNRGTTLFCLETVDWPEPMQKDFLVPTILYTGQKAIARYDQGIASRFHALFPSDSFKRIAEYFTERFGDPTEAFNRSIAPFAQPRQDNPILTWRSLDPETQVVTVLEIRKYDDSRGGFPDTNRGAVMLYLANSPPIFPQVSSHELMRISRTRLSQIPPPPSDQNPNAAFGPDGPPPDAPADGGADAQGEPAPTKSMKDLTAEEIQAMRRKRKAAEAAAKAGEAPPADDSFALPPDPLGR